MERLNDFNPADLVSQILRGVRVRSTVYCRSLLGAPWGFGVAARGNPAFHVVTSGSCWLEVDGEPRQFALGAGDLVVLPTGRRHWLRDNPASPATELGDILASTPLDEHRRLRHGGPGARTGLLCGGFALQGGTHPVLEALPPALHIRGVAGRPVPWLAATLALLSVETSADAPGAGEVVTRLADTLLTQALRVALAELESSDGAGIHALSDPQIAAAIELIHGQPERAWSVGGVAAEVSLSRSAFSARFRQLVGESPRSYITRTHLAHAATLLHATNASLAEIAGRVGYGSEFSFSKAFKRAFEISPGAYRGQPDQEPALTPAPHAAAPAH